MSGSDLVVPYGESEGGSEKSYPDLGTHALNFNFFRRSHWPQPQPQPQKCLFGFQGKVPVWTKRMFYAQLAGLLVLGTFREFVLGTGSKGWFGSPEPWEIQV